MSYTEDDVRNAFRRVRAIDAEHDADPRAYLERVGLPRAAVNLSFGLADVYWPIVAERLRVEPDSPLHGVLADEVRQTFAAATLRGIVIGEMLGRAASHEET